MVRNAQRVGFVPVVVLGLVAALLVAFGGGTAEAEPNDYHVVVFKDPPAVLAAAETGQRFDPQSEQTRAHVAHLNGVHGDYVRWLQRHAPQAEVVRDLVLASNAVAIDLNGADPALLSRGPGVKYTTPSTLYRPSMNASLEIIGADQVWGTEGISPRADAGSGVKVGVLDTGILAEHPFFASCGKEITHHGPYYSGDTGVADELFGAGVDIFFDHGTHVAGTIGGCVMTNVEVSPGVTVPSISGVAPGVELHDFNVFPGYGSGYVAFGGSAFSHDIAAAVDDAIAAEMDVINLSLGGGVQGPHDFLAEAIDAAAHALVPVVAAGNSGPAPGTVESPGSAANAITVGASTNSHIIALEVDVDLASTETTEPDHTFAGGVGDFGNFVAEEEDDETYPGDTPISDATVVPWQDVAGGDDTEACTSIGSGHFGGNEVALISRGTCTFSTKVANAEQAGAAAVIVYNNVPGDPFGMGASPSPETSIPATMISRSDGHALLAAIADETEPVTTSIAGPASELPADQDLLASFSSQGPTPFTYLAKPDLVAPGVNVISSVFTWDGGDDYTSGWAPFQGTSMATPHVAGAAALLLEGGVTSGTFETRSALVNHAFRPIMEWVETDDWALEAAGVLGRGGGRLDLVASVGATSFANPSSVSFGRIEGNKAATITRTVGLSGDTCTAATVTGDDGVTATVDGDVLTVTFASAALGSGDYEGDITVACAGSDLLLPWFAQVDRRGRG